MHKPGLVLKLIFCVALAAGLGVASSACNPSSTATGVPDDPVTPQVTPISASTSAPVAAMTLTALPTATVPITPTRVIPPSHTLSPTPFVCRQKQGRILQDQVSTDLLRHPIDFRVYLPPCYVQEIGQRYPVLYLIHGQSYNDDQWDRLGADEVADDLIYSGETSPFIIVMPRYRIWYQPDEHNFGRAMIEVLVPLVDDSYRTLPDRQHRAIGGLSMGAAWALHLGLSEWEYFSAVGLHSLALFSIDSPRIPGWLDAIPVEQLPRIFIDIGDKDSRNLLDSTRWFEEILTKKNIPHEWYLFSGYHEEKYWQEHTEQYIRWYTQDW